MLSFELLSINLYIDLLNYLHLGCSLEGRSVDVVLITYKDRLTRFGFEYIEEFFSTTGVRIEVVSGEEPKDGMQELVEDLISIITSFAGKIYGMRSLKKHS